jgi:hypothetical protein
MLFSIFSDLNFSKEVTHSFDLILSQFDLINGIDLPADRYFIVCVSQYTALVIPQSRMCLEHMNGEALPFFKFNLTV